MTSSEYEVINVMMTVWGNSEFKVRWEGQLEAGGQRKDIFFFEDKTKASLTELFCRSSSI